MFKGRFRRAETSSTECDTKEVGGFCVSHSNSNIIDSNKLGYCGNEMSINLCSRIVCSNRYGLTNEDLNRRWSNPNEILHPVIYHTKGLMEYCSRVLERPPHVFVDYHGHSRRKNVFLFGCSRSGSWSAVDRAKADQPVQYLVIGMNC